MADETTCDAALGTTGATPPKKTSPSRLAIITNKIVNLVASPLRQTVTESIPDVEVDEEISLRTRSQSSGGLVGTLLQAESSSLNVSNDQFFTPEASEGTLQTVCQQIEGNNLSHESVPEGFSRSFSIDENVVVKAKGPMGLSEFDPIGLIAFTSPQRQSSDPATTNSDNPPRGSLLDFEAPPPTIFTTPKSTPKYSEHDLQLFKQQQEERLEKQAEFMQLEIASMQEKYSQALRVGEEMRQLLGEYEKTIANLVETRRVDPERMNTMEQAEQGRQKLSLEAQSLRISFSNLKLLYDENKRTLDSLRISEQSLVAIIGQLRKELSESQKNYDTLLDHAQSRMNDANEELHRLKTTLEIELSATRAKLHKAELKVSSLESAVESKTRENTELMIICDELIQKIDSQAVAAGNPRSAAILSSLNIHRSVEK